ncbi:MULTISPECIES: DUF397 domain-containing protein [unclassified Streptomyces]|uniref:DUF397 domain-containing protein n=1 Tax=unclassified Streptomyces TaxID=2593676 RepID=UPI002958A609|nr:DUF397 domain-containing protein [Streptomyces sp. Wh19]MDV9194646.1 DUF397 domain-containing protein [Streptomyces sp. Wh19]
MNEMRTPTAPEMTSAGATWQKSTYSDGAGNNCVEVASLDGTRFEGVGIRDSKMPEGPALRVGSAAFTALVKSL